MRLSKELLLGIIQQNKCTNMSDINCVKDCELHSNCLMVLKGTVEDFKEEYNNSLRLRRGQAIKVFITLYGEEELFDVIL